MDKELLEALGYLKELTGAFVALAERMERYLPSSSIPARERVCIELDNLSDAVTEMKMDFGTP